MINDETINSVSQQETSNDSVDYIEAIREMKQNSVSREQYEKLKSENKELLDTLINGGQVTNVVEQKIDPYERINQLRIEMFSPDAVELSNLERAKKSLELRELNIQVGNGDDYWPRGRGIEITRDDIEKAQLLADNLRECIEIADGNSEVFTNELMRRTADIALPTAKKNSNPYNRR